MARSPAEVLSALRPAIADALVEGRGTVDQVYHELADDQLHGLFETMLGKLQAYLVDGDARAFGAYTRRWVTMRLGAGARHETLIPAVVGVGDTAIDVARDREGDTDEVRHLMRAVARANLIAARVVVEVLADEFERRRAQLAELVGGGA